MGRRACLLTQKDVPRYIRAIVKRLYPVLLEFEDEEGNWWGYTFRLDEKWKRNNEKQLEKDCQKLLAWCESWYAHAKLIKYMRGYNEVEYEKNCTHDHKRRVSGECGRNHALIVISDPVAHRFVKDGFYRN